MKKGIRQLAGKVVVVTGAASGIGRALAIGFAQEGARLALVDIDAEGLAVLQASLLQNNAGCIVTTHVANVGDKERMGLLASEVVDAHEAVHVLVNNAGVAYEGPFQQTSLEDWERLVAVNLWSVVYGCHFFMPHLAKVERAHIVNVSSLFGIVGMAGQTAYCATKYAVRGLSEALWEELRPTSVGLTVVHPGGVATNIMRRSRGVDAELLDRVSDWYEKHAMRPEKAAAQIIRAVQRGQPRLLITPEATLGDLIRRLMPVTGNRLFGDAVIRILGVGDMRRKRMDQWRATMIETDVVQTPPERD